MDNIAKTCCKHEKYHCKFELDSLQSTYSRNDRLHTVGGCDWISESRMSKTVKLGKGKDFTFASPAPGGGQPSKYPWDEWFDGTLLLLERSFGDQDDAGNITNVHDKKDYEVGTNAMVPKMKTAARKRYKVVQVSRLDQDGKRLVDSLIIRARDMTADERDAEDILRAEEKAEKKAKKAESNGQAAVTTLSVATS